MNRIDLYNSFNEVDDDILERSETAVQSRKRLVWLKWSAMAACLCFIAAITLSHFRPADFNDDSFVPPTSTGEIPSGTPDECSFTPYGSTSDTYTDLPELLAYLSDHETHDSGRSDALGGNSVSSVSGEASQLERIELVENTGAAVNTTGEYSYHIGESSVYISQLNGGDTKNIGSIDVSADGIFICNNNLLIVSQYQSGGDELNQEMSVCVSIYDVTVPPNPVLLDEYTQLGELTACWMVGADLYLVTSDGVCACGWSRLDKTADYYPALSHNGETMEWGDEEISILGEPTMVRYSAVVVINGNNREVVEKEALYGNILKLFYGEDWIAAMVASETKECRENPVLYTFDHDLNFTGKINAAQIMNAPEQNELKDYMPQNGDYLSIDSATKAGGIYHMLGTYTVRDGESTVSYFMAIAANTETGEAGAQLLSAESYPYGSFTEILWEPDCAIACVGIMNNAFTADMEQETRFIFAKFDGLEVKFHENELRADYLAGRVGVGYGNPLGKFETLIPMGQGVYLRYSHPAEGPGGFDVFDFSDIAAPQLLYRANASLSGEDAFDYVWYVYDEHTFGTLKVLLGDEDYFRNVKLSWCVYSVDPNNETVVSLQHEYLLDEEVKTFFGADGIGFTVFDAGGDLYYVTRNMTFAVKLGL